MQVVWSDKKSREAVKKGERMENSELIKHFSPDLFIPDLHATNKGEALEELSELFVASKLIRNRQLFLEMLSKRETLGSTGIGKGVAIPHGRTTATMDVKVAFAKSQEGIDFDAIDKKPVNLIFVVIAPVQGDNDKYLHVLAKLMEIVSKKANRDQLLKVQSFEELINVFTGK